MFAYLKKQTVIFLFTVFVSGCASHANIKDVDNAKLIDDELSGKTVDYQIFYAQPTPGLLWAGGEEQDLKPIDETKRSVGANEAMKNIDSLIKQSLPAGMQVVDQENNPGYELRVKLWANSKQGPTFVDHHFLKSLGISFISLGLGPSYWTIANDFRVKYEWHSDNELVLSDSFTLSQSVSHSTSFFEIPSDTFERPRRKLFEKNLKISMQKFYDEIRVQTLSE